MFLLFMILRTCMRVCECGRVGLQQTWSCFITCALYSRAGGACQTPPHSVMADEVDDDDDDNISTT